VRQALAALAVLLLDLYVYHGFARAELRPVRRLFSEFPLELGPWRCAGRERMPPHVEANLGVTDYLLCSFRRDGDPVPVEVYVGYHATQVRLEGGGGEENAIHPPRHCLPGAGWDVVEHEREALAFPGLPASPARVNRLVIAKGEARQLVYYWYQSQGRVIADDWRKVVLLSWDRARRGRTDGSLVRFTVPLERERAAAEARFRELAPRLLAELPAYVPN
jgi:EpsI family protein